MTGGQGFELRTLGLAVEIIGEAHIIFFRLALVGFEDHAVVFAEVTNLRFGLLVGLLSLVGLAQVQKKHKLIN